MGTATATAAPTATAPDATASFLGAPTATAPATTPGRGADRAVAQRALDELAASGAQGVQARLTDGRHQSVLRSGTAHHGRRTPVPLDGRFRAGSITKVFVATVVLQLVAEGKVQLDEPVSRHLPGLLPDGDRITVRMLLQHTSGLENYTDQVLGDALFADPATYEKARYQHHEARDLVGLATKLPLRFQPGTRWEYSNTNYLVAGLLIEKITGRPYGEAVQRRIIGPLGLRGTSVPGDTVALPPPHAHGYARIGGQVVNLTRLNPTVAGAAGEIVSTTADLDRFLDALLDGELLPAAQLADMKRTTAVSPQYGLGLVVTPTSCGVTTYGHTGGIPGYLSVAFSTADTRKRVVVSLTTAPDPGEFRGSDQLVDGAFCG
ncbi:serine hydrolase domain-containing protein [Kineococcus sp. NUM-3379]